MRLSNGNAKGGGFTGAGLGHAQKMVTGQQRRNGLRLNGRRFFVADGGHGFKYGRVQTQFRQRDNSDIDLLGNSGGKALRGNA